MINQIELINSQRKNVRIKSLAVQDVKLMFL